MFIHSVLEVDALISADGDEVIDLPVNPLSVILLEISPLNNTATLADYRLLEGMLSALDNIDITHKGNSVLTTNGIDLAALALLYHRLPIWQSNAVAANNDRRSLVLPILFGRRPYMSNECFPETRRGEFQMRITWDIADTGFDGLRRSVETIELPDATPEFVQKITTLAQTFGATGQNDIDLPIGNVLRAVLLFGTTGFAGATPVPSLADIQFFVDNQQRNYSGTRFSVLRAVMGLSGAGFPAGFRHVHDPNFDVTSADGTDLATTQTLANEIKADLNALTAVLEPEIGASLDDNYALLLHDVTGDDEHSINTDGAGRVNVRVDADTADAVRALPIERVPVSIFTG